MMKLYKKLLGKVKNATINVVQQLFDEVGYKKSFSRHDIKELANVKNSRASDIIKNCWKNI